MKTLILTLLTFTITTATSQLTTKDLKGVWHCYKSLADTLENGNEGAYMLFTDSTVQFLVSFTPGLEPVMMDKPTKYEIKKGVLVLYENPISYANIKIHHKSLLQMTTKDGATDIVIYLKKE